MNMLALAMMMAAAVPDALLMEKPGVAKPEGWLRDWSAAAVKGYVSHMDDVDKQFRLAWTTNVCHRGRGLDFAGPSGVTGGGSWSMEGGTYWFDGLVRMAAQMDDAELMALAKRRLEPYLSHMHPNAVGLCWWLDARKASDWDDALNGNRGFQRWVWGNAGYALSAWYEVSGDERARNALKWLFTAPQFRDSGSPTYLAGAYRAWRATGDKDIQSALDIASDRISKHRDGYAYPPFPGLERSLYLKYNDMNSWVHNQPVIQVPQSRHYPTTANWLNTVVTAYRRTGDVRLISSLRSWYDFFAKYVDMPHGTPCGDEEYGFAGPRRGSEVCGIAIDVWARLGLIESTGEGAWGDQIERMVFNASAAAVNRDWTGSVYYVMANRTCDTPDTDYADRWGGTNGVNVRASYRLGHAPWCCTAAIPRLIPEYVQGMWMKTPDNRSVVAALYGPSRFSTKLAGGEFAIEETTDYPFAERIAFKVTANSAGTVPLKLRVPGWCKNAALAVNGAAEPIRPEKGFASVSRAWRAGDRLELTLPMVPTVTTMRDYVDFGKRYAYVTMGPILFARGFAEMDDNHAAEEVVIPEVNPRTMLEGVKVVRGALPRPWNWPLASPLRVVARDAANRPLELVPFGCAKLRAALLPVRAGKAAFDAAEFGFSPDAAPAVNAQALQRALEGGCRRVVVSRPGVYRLDRTICIDDDTMLEFAKGVVLSKAKVYANVLANRAAFAGGRNKNIAVRGANIRANGFEATPPFSSRACGLRGLIGFYGVDNLRLCDTVINDFGTSQYAVQIVDFDGLLIDGFELRGNKDGVHLNCGRNFVVRNGKLRTYDDGIALNAGEWPGGCTPRMGSITDGLIENIVDEPGGHCNFARVITGAWQAWRKGMKLQYRDIFTIGNDVYSVYPGKVSTNEVVSLTPPSHKSGIWKSPEGINFYHLQSDGCRKAEIRRVTFRNIRMNAARAISCSWELGEWARLIHPDLPRERYPAIDIRLENIVKTADGAMVYGNADADIVLENCRSENKDRVLVSMNWSKKYFTKCPIRHITVDGAKKTFDRGNVWIVGK